MTAALIPSEIIENKIFIIRGKKVMIDRDLANLYGVATKALNQAVRRNLERFPEDFMFQLRKEEFRNWKSRIVTSNSEKMGLRKSPLAFTEHGILMLSSVLHSPRAIQVNIQIMRAFVKLRELMITHKGLAGKIEELEIKFKKHDENFVIVFNAIKKLLQAPVESPKKKLPIGFHAFSSENRPKFHIKGKLKKS